MKILVICSAGTVRSVGMAHVLKQRWGHDAVPVGHDANSQATVDLLSDWADRIIVMQPSYAKGILKMHLRKIVDPALTNVGPDRWQNPLHLGLQRIVYKMAMELHQRKILEKR
jgi:predicted protein tyrosine phosphatase